MSKEKINPSQEYEYLQFVELKNFLLWDVKKYTKKFISYSNKNFTYLKNHIEERSKKIKLANHPKDEFGILGVNNEIGIFDAYITKGSEINQPYKELETGWLAYNPYRINVGSIGLKTKDHSGKYISPAYVVFSCKNTLLPEFLFKLFKTNNFNNLIKENTSGSVRQILSFEALTNIQIPLPPLEKQKELVAIYNKKILEAETKEQKANQLEKSIDEYLIGELGIELPEVAQNQDGFLKFVEFKDLSRWDNNFFRKNKSNYTSRYPIVNFNQIIKFLKNGIAARNFSEKGLEYLRVGNVRDNKIIDKDLKYTKTFTNNDVLKKGTLLITRKGTVGESAIVKFDNKFVASSEIFIITLFDSVGGIEINNNYISFVNSSSFIQEQYKEKSTGAFMPSISQQKLRSLHFPLPPLPIQNQIANKISSIKQEIKTLRSEAENLKTQAKEEFEKEVFS